MCTLAWGQNNGRLWICFNRDEQHTRPEAEPPGLWGTPGKRLAYARDPVGKGTWFVASERGFVVALMNHYPDESAESTGPETSRGQAVLQLARMNSLDEVKACLEEIRYEAYRPFDLFLFTPNRIFTRAWDGSDLLTFACPHNFWTTSSHLQDQVRPWRTRWWREQTRHRRLDADSAGAILQSRCRERPEFGVTMDREDAGTVSQIRLQMDGNGFVFKYSPRVRAGAYQAETILRCPCQA